MFKEQYYKKKHFDKVNIPEKELMVVHWDGKLLISVLKSKHCEQTDIVI